MLTIHHLGKSQSERIVWLCEELGLPYQLKHYQRLASNQLGPPEYKALHPIGTAPVIEDGDLLLSESGAIIDYILARYGNGRLAPGAGDPDFAQYLYWYHFANSSLQPSMGRNMMLRRLDLPAEHPIAAAQRVRLELLLDTLNTRLGAVPYLAGEFSAADVMLVFSLTTMRYFLPLDLAPYPHILAYLRRIGARDAYQRAMQKGDPGMKLLLD